MSDALRAEIDTNQASRPTRKSSPLAPWGMLVVVVMLGYLLLKTWAGGSGPVGEKHPGVGQPMIFVGLQSLDDPSRHVGLEDLSGKVVLLNFWGTWCPPCRVELPHIAALEKKYGPREGFELLAVSCAADGNDEIVSLRSETLAYLENNGLKLPTYADPGAQTRSALQLTIGFEGYPTTVLFDRRGTVRGVWVGYQRGYERQMDGLIEQVLGES